VSKVKTAKISSPAPPDDLQPALRADVAAFSTEEKVLVELRKIIRATQIKRSNWLGKPALPPRSSS
jgi:hypothetical protein